MPACDAHITGAYRQYLAQGSHTGAKRPSVIAGQSFGECRVVDFADVGGLVGVVALCHARIGRVGVCESHDRLVGGHQVRIRIRAPTAKQAATIR